MFTFKLFIRIKWFDILILPHFNLMTLLFVGFNYPVFYVIYLDDQERLGTTEMKFVFISTFSYSGTA